MALAACIDEWNFVGKICELGGVRVTLTSVEEKKAFKRINLIDSDYNMERTIRPALKPFLASFR